MEEMPDGSVACARRRGFRAADPAHGRAARPERRLGARRRGAGANAGRASGSRLCRPAPGQARPADQPQRDHRTGARSRSSRTSSGARPASGATPRYSSGSRGPTRRSTSIFPTSCAEPSAAGAAPRGQGETGFRPARRADRSAAEVALAASLAAPPDRHSWRRRSHTGRRACSGHVFRLSSRRSPPAGPGARPGAGVRWRCRSAPQITATGKPKGSNLRAQRFLTRKPMRGGKQNEDRADRAADRKRSAPAVRRHRADRRPI